MSLAKITYKGQVTIPKKVREALNLRDGDSVAFVVEGDRAMIMPVRQATLEDFYGAFPATRPYTDKATVREEVKTRVAEQAQKELE